MTSALHPDHTIHATLRICMVVGPASSRDAESFGLARDIGDLGALRSMLIRVVAMIGLSSCVPPSGTPALDTTFGSYSRALDDPTAHPKGTLPRSLEVPPVTADGFELSARTIPPMWFRTLVYDGISGDEICFQEFDNDVDLHDDAEELGKRNLEAAEIRIEVLSQLPTSRSLWPSTGSALTYKAVASDTTEHPSGIPRRTVYWKECGPAPAVPPDARYLAAIVHHTKPIGTYPDDELLLWELK